MQILYGKSLAHLTELSFNVAKKDSSFSGEMRTPFKEYANIRFDGILTETETSGSYKAKGKLFKNLAAHDFEGEITLSKNLPTQALLTFDNFGGSAATLDYNLKFEDMKRSISAVVKKNDDFMSFESVLYVQNLLDWAYNIKVKSSEKDLDELMLSTTFTPLTKSQYESSFEMTTPWSDYLIDKVNVSTMLKTTATDGDFKLFYEISKFGGTSGCSWKWLQRLIKQEFQVKAFSTKKDGSKLFSTEIGYSNSTKTPTDMKFNINVQSLWILGSKTTFDIRNPKDVSFAYELNVPEPIKNKHKMIGQYKASMPFPPKLEAGSAADVHLGYFDDTSMGDLKTKGSISSFKDLTNLVVLQWGLKTDIQVVNSTFTMQENDKKVDCDWKLKTPYHKDENTLNLKATYDGQDEFKLIHTTIHYPESRQVTVGDIAFADLTNMKGFINCTLPLFNVSWFDVNFDFDKQNGVSGKFIKASWPDNFALLDSKSTYIHKGQQKEWKGTIKAELPLQSKHSAQIIYGLEVC